MITSIGLVASDYRGEWKATLHLKNSGYYQWNAGDRVLQFIIIPIPDITLEQVDEINTTERGSGGYGSTGL